MNTAKLIRDAGSGCCLLLPLLGGTATANQSLSTDVPTEFDLTFASDSSLLSPSEVRESLISIDAALEPEADSEARWIVDVRTLNLDPSGESDLSDESVMILSVEENDQSGATFEVVEPVELVGESTATEDLIEADQIEATQVEANQIEEETTESTTSAPNLSTPNLSAPNLSTPSPTVDKSWGKTDLGNKTSSTKTSSTKTSSTRTWDTNHADTIARAVSSFGVLLVELRTEESEGKKTLVKGAENGEAIAFDDWLIPFDDAISALGFSAAVEVDGKLTLKSSEITTQIQLESLPQDPDLGVAWSVADIAKHLGAAAEFDRDQYSIRFNQDAVNRDRSIQATADKHNSTYSALSAAAYSAATYVADASLSTEPTVDASSDEQSIEESILPNLNFLPLEQTNSPAQAGTEPKTATEPETTVEQETVEIETTEEVTSAELGVLLVGLNVGEITTVEATLVKGRENGEEAIAFDDWLIPFDDVMAALGANVTQEEDGLLSIYAPGLATLINPKMLTVDPEIGRSISVAEIKERFGIPAEFDRSLFAVKFMPAAATRSYNKFDQWFQGRQTSEPVDTDGLPVVNPSAFSLSAVSQSTRMNSSSNRLINDPQGQLSAVGSIFGGSWYARLNQPSLSDFNSWQLKEFQYLRPGDREDYVLGSQPTFWQARNTNQDYWGATTIQRWGFTPPQTRSIGGFNPRSRLQANKIGRTISGEAAPGTFVRLTRGLNGAVIDETIVNSSGLYRFENILSSSRLNDRFSSKGLLVQLYANGQLNSQPEIRSAAFTTLPGQLPKGASALVASAGMGYRTEQERVIGNFNTFRGGVAYRYGISDSLTLGAGLVQDGATQVLTEGFYIPDNLPVKAAFSATVDVATGDAEVDANVLYRPTDNLRLTFDSDRFSQRLKADWAIAPNFSLSATGDTRENTLALEANAAYEGNDWRASATAAVDTNQNLRWSFFGNKGPFQVSHRGSEVSTFTGASYNLSHTSNRTATYGTGHELALSYQTINSSAQTLRLSNGESLSVGTDSGMLATAEWRYRSPQRTVDGRSRWNFALGYGVSANRSGPIASATASLNSGLDVQMRYQGTSIFDESESLQVSLVSRLETQNRLGWGHRRQNELRTQGGIKLQPFFDDDADGIRDEDEEMYLDSPDLLFSINQDYIDRRESKIYSDGISLSLPADTYRLDVDPAGLPLDKTAAETSYAVTVVPGQYTTVAIPLMTTYSVSGVVIDENGLAVAGAQVEAIGVSGHRQQSITNGAGVYYLERLRPEDYAISVNGVLLEDSSIVLEGESETFLEQEIRLL